MRTPKVVLACMTAASLLVIPAQRAVGSGVTLQRSLTDVALNDVTTTGVNDAWAVGDGGLASHWDGTSWTSQHLGGQHSPDLNGVDAITSADLWTVGGVIVQDAFRGFAAHWDGSAWHRTTVPGYPGEMILQDVVAGSHHDVWAVGRWFADTPAGHKGGAVVIHWAGKRWHRVKIPAGVSSLVDATLLEGDALLAVGRAAGSGAPVALRGHLGAWRVIPLPTPLPPPSPSPPVQFSAPHCVARSVDGLPAVVVGTCWYGAAPDRHARPYVVDRSGDGTWTLRPVSGPASLWGVDHDAVTWAVGRRSTTGQPVTLRRRADGSWFRVATPATPSGGLLLAVDVESFANAWAVGWRQAGRSQRPLALHWDGAAWTMTPVPPA
jgi:hypothetical protein